eukprot:6652488-Pyramimonas_sp.AAC.1
MSRGVPLSDVDKEIDREIDGAIDVESPNVPGCPMVSRWVKSIVRSIRRPIVRSRGVPRCPVVSR